MNLGQERYEVLHLPQKKNNSRNTTGDNVVQNDDNIREIEITGWRSEDCNLTDANSAVDAADDDLDTDFDNDPGSSEIDNEYEDWKQWIWRWIWWWQ